MRRPDSDFFGSCWLPVAIKERYKSRKMRFLRGLVTALLLVIMLLCALFVLALFVPTMLILLKLTAALLS